MGKYHRERGCLLMHEDQLEQASAEFRAAREVFSNAEMPVETITSLIYLARIDYLRGSLSEAHNHFNRAQEIILSLGTFQSMIPVLADQLDLLSSLGDHIPDDRFIKDLIHAVDDFQTSLPGLMESMEFNPPDHDPSLSPMLDIYSMGRVYLKRNGDLLTAPEWTKQKTVRELFFYLLNRSEGVNREEICVVFWPDSKPEQLKKQFKNALYRLRRAVGTDSILYHQPTRLYHFNRDLDYRYDVEAFQAAIKEADQETDPELKIQALQSAADLYQHPFAPTLDGIWAEPVRHQRL